MDNNSFVPDNIPADLEKSWHIPRPTLARSSNSLQGSTSSKNSTQSARSGSQLLTAANLAQIHQQNERDDESRPSAGAMSTRDLNIQYYLQRTNQDNEFIASIPKTCKKPEPDNVSIASSMHFTVVNMNSRARTPKRSFCRKNQLTILILSMSAFFTIGILAAIYFLEKFQICGTLCRVKCFLTATTYNRYNCSRNEYIDISPQQLIHGASLVL